MKIRILSVQPDDIVLGGVQVRSLEVARKLRDRNIETEFLVDKLKKKINEKGIFTKKAEAEGFKVNYYQSFPRPKRFKNFSSIKHNLFWLFALPVSINSVRKVIKKGCFDLVHVNGLLNLPPIFAAKLANKKVVWHLIGDLYPNLVVKLLRPFIHRITDKAVFIAQSLKIYYLGDDSKKGEIIFEPVNIGNFSNSEIFDVKKEFEVDESKILITSVGNIVPSKGWFYFVDAAKIMLEQFSNLHFLIVGSISDNQKEYAKKLMEYIRVKDLEDVITLAGYREDVPQILRGSDVFMMASLMEGTPLVIFEAMAAQIPVIATDVGGISEQIMNGRTGFVVPPGDSEKLAGACLKLIRSQDLQQKFVERAYKRLKENFTLEICVNKHVQIYEELYY